MLGVVLAHTSSYPLDSNYIRKTLLVAFAMGSAMSLRTEISI